MRRGAGRWKPWSTRAVCWESLDIGQGVRDRPLIGGFVRGEPARVGGRGFKGSDQAKRSTRRGGNPAVTRYARKLAKAGRL